MQELQPNTPESSLKPIFSTPPSSGATYSAPEEKLSYIEKFDIELINKIYKTFRITDVENIEVHQIMFELIPGTYYGYLISGKYLIEQDIFINLMNILTDKMYYKHKPKERVELNIKRTKIIKSDSWQESIISLLRQTEVENISIQDFQNNIFKSEAVDNSLISRKKGLDKDYNLLARFNINI